MTRLSLHLWTDRQAPLVPSPLVLSESCCCPPPLFPLQAAAFLSQDVSGTYSLLEKCGHAAKGLHKREAPAPGQNDLFMFLDPSRCAGPETDHFVFATSHRKASSHSLPRPRAQRGRWTKGGGRCRIGEARDERKT